MRRYIYSALPLLVVVLIAADTPNRETGKKELSRLQPIVGEWRGVGQLRRGSTKGSWIEKSDWAWRFDERGASLSMSSSKGKYWKSATLKSQTKDGEYLLSLTGSDDKATEYRGKWDERDRLVLTAKEPKPGTPDRISMRFVASGKRLIVLLERRSGTGRFSRIAEVGYTRKGSRFGKGTSYVECVVTGGEGTIPVTFKGKTYYVCCGGCRDYFNDEPEKVLAEYRQKKAEEKAKEKAEQSK